MATMPTATVRVVLANSDAIDAYAEALQIVREAAADMAWRTDLKEATELLSQAAEGLGGIIDDS